MQKQLSMAEVKAWKKFELPIPMHIEEVGTPTPWKAGVSRNNKDLNDVTAALYLIYFSQLPAAKKQHPKEGSCETIKVLIISWRLQQKKINKSIDE